MADAVPPSIVPYLTVRDARRALAFYRDAFGGQTLMVLETEEGHVTHARTRIGEGLVMLYEEASHPLQGNAAPGELGGSPVAIRIEMASPQAVDTTFAGAIAVGAEAAMEPSDRGWGRMAHLRDPEGHCWSLAATVREAGA
ncbi:MAG: VOC family protein [Pseudomonadota bacterium]